MNAREAREQGDKYIGKTVLCNNDGQPFKVALFEDYYESDEYLTYFDENGALLVLHDSDNGWAEIIEEPIKPIYSIY